jgi:PKD repeat protein
MKTLMVSNEYGTDDKGTIIYIDRIYTNLHKDLELINKDGTEYSGRIDKRTIKLDDGTLGHVMVTTDDRWFDRCGMPIDKPINLVTHK